MERSEKYPFVRKMNKPGLFPLHPVLLPFWNIPNKIPSAFLNPKRLHAGKKKTAVATKMLLEVERAEAKAEKMIREESKPSEKRVVIIGGGDTQHTSQNVNKSGEENNKEKLNPKMLPINQRILIKEKITKAVVVDMYCAARYWNVPELKEKCKRFLSKSTIKEKTALKIYLNARKRKATEISDLMVPHISRYFLTFVALPDFLELDVSEVIKFLRSPSVGVNHEMEIFLSAFHWISYKWPERRENVDAVIDCINFTLIPPAGLFKVKATYYGLKQMREIFSKSKLAEVLFDGFIYHDICEKYRKNENKFYRAMQKYMIERPRPRKWIYDVRCSYHRFERFTGEDISYYAFIEYLATLLLSEKDLSSNVIFAPTRDPYPFKSTKAPNVVGDI